MPKLCGILKTKDFLKKNNINCSNFMQSKEMAIMYGYPLRGVFSPTYVINSCPLESVTTFLDLGVLLLLLLSLILI